MIKVHTNFHISLLYSLPLFLNRNLTTAISELKTTAENSSVYVVFRNNILSKIILLGTIVDKYCYPECDIQSLHKCEIWNMMNEEEDEEEECEMNTRPPVSGWNQNKSLWINTIQLRDMCR